MASRISIPAPCPASWADMTPAPGGRHCAACNKVVVDFSAMTTAEATAYLQRYPGACGRFRPEHLNPLSSWAPWLAAAVVALASASCEMEPAAVLPTEQAVQAESNSMLLVQGKVVIKGNDQPLAHVLIISEQDTTYHARTAADGTFALWLPQHMRGTSLVAILAPSSDDFGFYRPRYFPADDIAPVQIRLRNSMAATGAPRLEPEECLSPAAKSILFAPPPPPPKLTTFSSSTSSALE